MAAENRKGRKKLEVVLEKLDHEEQTTSPEYPAQSGSLLIIRPSHGWAALKVADVWAYRDLLGFLIWRDLKVRYKQTLLGVVWIVLHPLSTMLIYTVVFGFLARIPTGSVPYAVFFFCGLLPWHLFSQIVTGATTSLAANQNLITKVYFPRLVVPLATALSRLVDVPITVGLLLIIMGCHGMAPAATALLLPVFALIAALTALAVGLWLAALNSHYRDVGHALPSLLQFWMFCTPIIYPVSLVPASWQFLYSVNPMVTVVEGTRWALLGHGTLSLAAVAMSLGVVSLLLIGGLYYFRRIENTLADVV